MPPTSPCPRLAGLTELYAKRTSSRPGINWSVSTSSLCPNLLKILIPLPSAAETIPRIRVFREAAVNLLIHQDYGDHSRKAVIKFFRDGIQFWNPGDVFGDDSRLLEPGEKEVRNPVIATAMRRVAMCEQAGTGLRMMREAW